MLPSICVDSATSRSVIGKYGLTKTNSFFSNNLLLSPSPFPFRFGNKTYRSNGAVNVTLLTPQSTEEKMVPLEVVDVDIPPLIGFRIVEKYELLIANVHNRLVKRCQCNQNRKIYYIEDWFPLISSHSFPKFLNNNAIILLIIH